MFKVLSVNRISAYAVVRIQPQISRFGFTSWPGLRQSLAKFIFQSLYMFLSLFEAKFSSHSIANVGIIFWLVLSLWILQLG